MSAAAALPSKLDTKEVARFYQDCDTLIEGCFYPRDGVLEDTGPEVLADGETVTINLGNGLHHGGDGGASTIAQQKGVGSAARFHFLRFGLRNKSIQLTGPLTALQVLQKLAEAVRSEAARNHMLQQMLSPYNEEEDSDDASASGFKLPAFPADQRTQYEADEATSRSKGRVPVLDVYPDPMTQMTPEEVEHVLRKWDDEGLDGGATAFEGFMRYRSNPDVYIAKWSEPFA
jgi:hypothetical protein